MRPVSSSTSTTATCVPNGKTKLGGSKVTWAARPGSTPSGRSWAVNASNATVARAIARVGVPLTRSSPSTSSRSSSAHSSWWGAMGRALGTYWVGDIPPRHAADRERAAAVGVHAVGADRRVGVQHLDVVGIDAEPVGHDLRPRRLVPLPVRRGAADDLHLAGGQHAHAGGLPPACGVVERRQHPAGGEAAHLDVGGDAEAAVPGVACLAAAPLLA